MESAVYACKELFAALRRQGTREPRRRGAICCCGLSRQPHARSGQTVGEVQPTSLLSSSTVFTVGAGRTGLMRGTGFRSFQFIDKVLNFPVVLRKRRTYSVTFQSTTRPHRCSSWTCLVVTVQTTVEVLQLLEVPVEIPKVQFLDKFDTPVMRVFFDKVVDGPVVLSNMCPLLRLALQACCEGNQVGFIMSVINIFVSSLSIITLDHMKSLKNITLDGNTGHFDEEIDLAGSESFGDNIQPQLIFSSSRCLSLHQVASSTGIDHSVTVLASGRLRDLGCATAFVPS